MLWLSFYGYKKWHISFFLTVSFLALSLSPVFAETYFVSTTGNDSNPGTEAQPWRTIQKAANTVTAGDTVIVKAGTYDERVTFPSGTTGNEGNKIVFKADPRRSVYMKGFRTTNVNYLRIDGFNITYTAGGWGGGGVWLTSSYVEIVDNYFYDIPGSAISPAWSGAQPSNIYIAKNKIYKCNKGFVISYNNWLVEHNEVERLYRQPSGGEDADYVRFFGENHVIRNNYFHGTLVGEVGASHVDVFQTFGDKCIPIAKNIIIENNIAMGFYHQGFMMTGDCGKHENIIIRNNIMVAPNASWALLAMGIKNLKVYNNIFVNYNLYGVFCREETRGDGIYITTGEIKNNIFYNPNSNSYWGNFPKNECVGSNNLLYRSGNTIPQQNFPNDIVNQDPKFVDVGNNKFRLQANSPALNAGVTLSGFSSDIEGRSRPQGSAWDIGAYEYVKDLLPPSGLRIISQ